MFLVSVIIICSIVVVYFLIPQEVIMDVLITIKSMLPIMLYFLLLLIILLNFNQHCKILQNDTLVKIIMMTMLGNRLKSLFSCVSWFCHYCCQRFADWRWAGFSAQKLVRRTELSVTTKLSSGDETPPIANVLL
jgi:hypothetical protein